MEQKTCGVGEQTQRGVLAEGWGPAWLLVMRPTPWDAVIKLSCVQSHRGLGHLGHSSAKEMPC